MASAFHAMWLLSQKVHLLRVGEMMGKTVPKSSNVCCGICPKMGGPFGIIWILRCRSQVQVIIILESLKRKRYNDRNRRFLIHKRCNEIMVRRESVHDWDGIKLLV